MARTLRSDKVLFTATLLLVCASVVMVYSASAGRAVDQPNAPMLLLAKQVTWALVGLFLGGVVMRIDYRHYRQPAIIWAGLAVVTAGLIAVLLGRPINGAMRWLNVGPLGV